MEDVLKVIIPAVAVIGVAIFFFERAVRQMRTQDTPNRGLEREKIMLPLQVQAYERLTLLLERITPSPLVMRVNDQKSNSAQLQLASCCVPFAMSLSTTFPCRFMSAMPCGPKWWPHGTRRTGHPNRSPVGGRYGAVTAFVSTDF